MWDRYDKSINLSGSWVVMVGCCTLKYQSGSRASVRSTEEVAEAGLVLVLGLLTRGGGSLEPALGRGGGGATLLLVSASPWYHDHIGLKMSSTLCSLHRTLSSALPSVLPSALPRLLALCLVPVSRPL